MPTENTKPPTPPFLFLDAYSLDFGPTPAWASMLAAEPALRGVILKATDGIPVYNPLGGGWFRHNYRVLTTLFGPERGVTSLVGAYHYVQFSAPAVAQADAYVRELEAAGYNGLDIMPILDAEAGGERSTNRQASAAQVVDSVSAVAARVKALTGRPRVMLYGRGLMRDLGIASKMGCDAVWNPSYTRLMVTNGLMPISRREDGKTFPWTLDDVALWQYEGDGVADTSFTHLTKVVAGRAKVDLSVYVDGDRASTWTGALERLR